MKTTIESLTLNEDQVEAVIKISATVKDYTPRTYDIQNEVRERIVREISDKWIAEHAVEVMKAIDASAIVNMVSLRAAKIIRD